MTNVDIDRWISILMNLPLSRAELDLIKRYEDNPRGRTFLALSEILRSRNYYDECIELLSEGLERHPGFTVARVMLARDMFARGLAAQSLTVLIQSPESLHKNVLAQKLLLKLFVVLGKESDALRIWENVKHLNAIDSQVERLGQDLETEPFDRVSKRFILELKSSGVPLVSSSDDKEKSDKEVKLSKGVIREGASTNLVSVPIIDQEKISGFHVVPLKEVFSTAERLGVFGKGDSVELDAVTLAEIYEIQGYYSKALEIYHRLLNKSPNSDRIRKKIADTKKSLAKQKSVDKGIDADMVHQMEEIQIIDEKIRFMSQLLEKLRHDNQ